ncbi:MAG: ABC transporter permease [Thermomicrobiales bacterium]
MASTTTSTPIIPASAPTEPTRSAPIRLGPIDLGAIAMLCQRDLTRFWRERAQLYGSLARTVVWLFLLGTGLRGAVTLPGDVSYLSFIFPGMLAMAIIFTSLQSAISIIFDREFGFLKEIMVAPIPRTSIVIGKALAGGLIATLQGCIIFIFAPFVGISLKPLNLLAAIAVMLILGIGLTGLGLTISARMTSFEGFGTVNNFVVLPLYFLSGAQFPVHNVPDWMRIFIHLNPLYYGVELLRGLLVGLWNRNGWIDLAVLVGFMMITLATATWSFTRQE